MCAHEYIRDFEVTTVGFKCTGRKCTQPNCSGRLRDQVLDWEDALPPKELAAAERCAAFRGRATVRAKVRVRVRVRALSLASHPLTGSTLSLAPRHWSLQWVGVLKEIKKAVAGTGHSQRL